MKYPSLTLVLVFSFALTDCGWNPFHKMYSATAVIQIRPWGEMSTIGPRPTFADPPDSPNAIAAQIDDNMWNAETLTPIIQNLKLNQIWAKRFRSDHGALSPQEALDHLHKVLKIEWVSGTNMFKITTISEVPKEAADIANAFADHYKALRDQEEVVRNSRGEDALREQIAQQQKVVEDSKAASAKSPNDMNGLREFEQQQALLDALNVRLNQVIADGKIMESPVRIISRAVPPPE